MLHVYTQNIGLKSLLSQNSLLQCMAWPTSINKSFVFFYLSFFIQLLCFFSIFGKAHYRPSCFLLSLTCFILLFVHYLHSTRFPSFYAISTSLCTYVILRILLHSERLLYTYVFSPTIEFKIVCPIIPLLDKLLK